MINDAERQQIIALVKREVVPAIGCTEPIAVALCVAKAAETLGVKPEKVSVWLSANILKNAMGVGIPGTGMIGLPIAIALGALIGKSEYQLEVLKDSVPEAVEAGKRFIDEKRISIALKPNIDEKLYIEVCCEAGSDRSTAIIAGGHTSFVYVSHNGDVLLDKQTASAEEEENTVPDLTLRKVYDFAMTAPLDEIRFILDTAPKPLQNSPLLVIMGMAWEKCFVELMSIKSWATVSFHIYCLIPRGLVMHAWQEP